jgi:hypothetical protein
LFAVITGFNAILGCIRAKNWLPNRKQLAVWDKLRAFLFARGLFFEGDGPSGWCLHSRICWISSLISMAPIEPVDCSKRMNRWRYFFSIVSGAVRQIFLTNGYGSQASMIFFCLQICVQAALVTPVILSDLFLPGTCSCSGEMKKVTIAMYLGTCG